jgi:hypothetical protein
MGIWDFFETIAVNPSLPTFKLSNRYNFASEKAKAGRWLTAINRLAMKQSLGQIQAQILAVRNIGQRSRVRLHQPWGVDEAS